MDAVSLKLARNYTNEKLNSLPSNRPTKTVSFDGGIYSVGNNVVNGQVSAILKGNTWTNKAGIGDTSPQTIENLDSAKTYLLIKTDGGTVNVDAVDTAVPAKITGKTSTVLTWASGKIALYELSTAEAALTETQLGARYHYVSGTKSTNSVRIRSVGKNLFNADKEIDANSTYVSLANYNGALCMTWESGSSASNVVFMQGKFKPNTRYTLSGKMAAAGGNVAIRFVYTDGTHDLLQFNNTSFDTKQLTSTEGKTVSSIEGHWVSSSRYVYIDLNSFIVNEGTSPAPYESYKESSIIVPEVGRSVPVAKDEVSVISGKETRRNKKYVLQADDIIFISQTGTYVDSITIRAFSDFSAVQKWEQAYPELITDRTTGRATSSWDLETSYWTHAYDSSKQIYIYIPKGTYANLTEARSAFAGTTLIYQLATPIVTKLPAQAPLQVFENGTVYVEPMGDPSETTLPTVELTVPIGAPNKFGSASHDYEGAAADWVLNDSEQKCLILVATNSGGNANIILPKKSGLVYLVDNKTDYNIVCKSVGDVAGTTILSGNSGLIYNI